MPTPSPPGPPNRRTTRRVVLRQPAALLLPGGVSRPVIVWDLGLDGMSVLSPKPVPPGTRCELHFGLSHAGQLTDLRLQGKTVYSSFVGTGGFRIGLVFTQLAPAAADAVERFIAAAP